MPNAIIAFCDKPESCSKCVGRRYCKEKELKVCPIQEIPRLVRSEIKDDYCAGWDEAVRLILLDIDPKYNFMIPVTNEDFCVKCAMRVKNACPFLQEVSDFHCYKEENFWGTVISLPVAGLTDYAMGCSDGAEWLMGELGIKKSDDRDSYDGFMDD